MGSWLRPARRQSESRASGDICLQQSLRALFAGQVRLRLLLLLLLLLLLFALMLCPSLREGWVAESDTLNIRI